LNVVSTVVPPGPDSITDLSSHSIGDWEAEVRGYGRDVFLRIAGSGE
jgi:hypothetical protein